MTTFADAYSDIRARFETMWPALHPDIRVLWPNERIDPLVDPSIDTAWVAWELNGGSEAIATFGGLSNNRYRQNIDVVIHIFVEVGKGEALARTLAADASSIYRGWQNGNIKFSSADTASSSAQDISGNWSNPVDCLCSGYFDYTA